MNSGGQAAAASSLFSSLVSLILYLSLFSLLFMNQVHSYSLHPSFHRIGRRWKSHQNFIRFAARQFSPKRNNNHEGSYADAMNQEIPNIQYPNFKFDILDRDPNSNARTGLLHTPHGNVETPNFIFCATKAAIKGVTMDQMRAEGTQFILSNTYHLMLAPGEEIVHKLGGLQKMTSWRGPMLTDSGGYQIFSMGHGSVAEEIKGNRKMENAGMNKTLVSIDEVGAKFRSYVDNTIHELTPERSIDIQRKLGADIILVLDECTPFHVPKNYTDESTRRSHRWADRSLRRFAATTNGEQALYGIVQGGIYKHLRMESAAYVNSRPFFGIAIGGSLGADKQQMYSIVAFTRAQLRNDCPIHLLGIGGIRDIFHGVRQGIDTFDCVHPTRLGRHGGALVMAAHWDEEQHDDPSFQPPQLQIAATMTEKRVRNEESRLKTFRQRKGKIQKQLMYFSRAAHQHEQRQLHQRQEHSAQQRPMDGNPQEMVDRLRDELVVLEQNIVHSLQVIEKEKELLRVRREKIMKQTMVRPVSEDIYLKKAKFSTDPRPIDPNCECSTCRNYSRAYLHHLVKVDEMIASTLLTIHNVHFMNKLMQRIRQGIKDGTLDEVERMYVHPGLKDEGVKEGDGLLSDEQDEGDLQMTAPVEEEPEEVTSEGLVDEPEEQDQDINVR